MKKITTITGLFGNKYHYDESGELIGTSTRGLFGNSWDHHDANGEFVGSSDPGIFADLVHRDSSGDLIGSSYESFGFENHYDADGDFVGSTIDTLFGESTDLF